MGMGMGVACGMWDVGCGWDGVDGGGRAGWPAIRPHRSAAAHKRHRTDGDLDLDFDFLMMTVEKSAQRWEEKRASAAV